MLSFRERAALAWRILFAGPSGLVEYAESELERVAAEDEEAGIEDGREWDRKVLELLLVFSTQGHSGMSAMASIALFERLAHFKPLGPLTGLEDEWMEVEGGSSPMWQNKRCSSVFRQEVVTKEPVPADDPAVMDRISHQFYDVEAVVFRGPDGITYSRPSSLRDVTMPYDVPDEPEVIEVDEGGAPLPRKIALAENIVREIEGLLPMHGPAMALRGALSALLAQR